VTSPGHQTTSLFLPEQIVSGGQTGVDRAALDVAIALGIAHGGWCPAGRLSEDGSVPSRYELQETTSSEYPVRTEQNVIDSDATLILCVDQLRGGTRLTKRLCARHCKPHLVVRIDQGQQKEVHQWLARQRPKCLNVAGPRESTSPGIYDLAMDYLLQLLQ
jgi:hypothetical protein